MDYRDYANLSKPSSESPPKFFESEGSKKSDINAVRQSSKDSKIPDLQDVLSENQTSITAKLSSKNVVSNQSHHESTSQSLFNEKFPDVKKQNEMTIENGYLMTKQNNGVEKNLLDSWKKEVNNDKEATKKELDDLNIKLEECINGDGSIEELEKLGEAIEKVESRLNELDENLKNLNMIKVQSEEKKLHEISENIALNKEDVALSKESIVSESQKIYEIELTQEEKNKLFANIRLYTLEDGKAQARFVREVDIEHSGKKLISIDPNIGHLKTHKDKAADFNVGQIIRVEIEEGKFKEIEIKTIEYFNEKELVFISLNIANIVTNYNSDKKTEEKHKNASQEKLSYVIKERKEPKEPVKNQNQNEGLNNFKIDINTLLGTKEKSGLEVIKEFFEKSLKEFDKKQKSIQRQELSKENKKSDLEIYEKYKDENNKLDVKIDGLLKEVDHHKTLITQDTSTKLRNYSARLGELVLMSKYETNTGNYKEQISIKKEIVNILYELTSTSGSQKTKGTDHK